MAEAERCRGLCGHVRGVSARAGGVGIPRNYARGKLGRRACCFPAMCASKAAAEGPVHGVGRASGRRTCRTATT